MTMTSSFLRKHQVCSHLETYTKCSCLSGTLLFKNFTHNVFLTQFLIWKSFFSEASWTWINSTIYFSYTIQFYFLKYLYHYQVHYSFLSFDTSHWQMSFWRQEDTLFKLNFHLPHWEQYIAKYRSQEIIVLQMSPFIFCV